ncbi:MAG: hypothetical protein J2P21_31045 [Chloracidobacterium sp.]|nr:hypothetical protein [Chloracidobacterium sp.]
MNKRIAVAFLLLLGVMFTIEGTRCELSSRAAAQEKPSPAPNPSALLGCAFIDALDDSIQTRFTQINLNRGFGIARVTPLYHSLGLFVPENDQEKKAVAEIERSGKKMVIYLASRFALESAPDESQVKDLMFSHLPLVGPVAITKTTQKTDWPEALSLWKQARKVMQNFDGEKAARQREFSVEGKDFIARPVRAQESCLKCHTPQAYMSYLKYTVNSDGPLLRELIVSDQVRQIGVGDPIGALLYAYTNSTKSTIVKNQ